MGLRINTNVQSLAAQRFLMLNRIQQDKSLERLSSGNRINRAGDDAAGLAISERLKANIRSIGQATPRGTEGLAKRGDRREQKQHQREGNADSSPNAEWRQGMEPCSMIRFLDRFHRSLKQFQ